MTASLQVNKKDGKYYIHLNWQDATDHRKQKCIGTGLLAKDGTKRKAEQMMRETLHEWEKKVCINSSEILFSDYLARWLLDVRHTIAESTFVNYKGVLDSVICPYFKSRGIRLIDLTTHDIQLFYNYRMDNNGISPNTVHRYHAIIHRALDYAVHTKQLYCNPSDGVELPKEQMHTASFLTESESRKLLGAVQNTDLEPVVRLALWFGLRRGEIIGLKWQDTDLENKRLLVCGVIAKANKDIYKEPKTKASKRSFPLTDEMVSFFRELKNRQIENRKKYRHSYTEKHAEFVCVNAYGVRLNLDYVTKAIPKICERIGLPRTKLHELRHTNITLLLESGASMKEAQEWAGHSSFSVTANVYAHVIPGSKTQLSESIQRALG